jgi:hypothetical protein
MSFSYYDSQHAIDIEIRDLCEQHYNEIKDFLISLKEKVRYEPASTKTDL